MYIYTIASKYQTIVEGGTLLCYRQTEKVFTPISTVRKNKLIQCLALNGMQDTKGKSPGPDNLNSFFLCEAADGLCTPLAIIFNFSLEVGEIPED